MKNFLDIMNDPYLMAAPKEKMNLVQSLGQLQLKPGADEISKKKGWSWRFWR
jgi:hypothetical protein